MGTKTKTKKATKTVGKTKRTKSKVTTPDTVAFNVSVPKSFLKKIDAQAKKANLPRSAFVRTTLQANI